MKRPYHQHIKKKYAIPLFICRVLIAYAFLIYCYAQLLLPRVTLHSADSVSATFHIDYQPHQAATFRVTVPACVESLRINAQAVKLPVSSDYWRCGRSRHGFPMDLSAQLKPGKNVLDVTYEVPKLDANGQPQTFNPATRILNPMVAGYNSEFFPGLLLILIACVLLPQLFPQEDRLGRSGRWLLLGAGVFYALCISRTTYVSYSQDIGGHLAYINKIANQFMLPRTNAGWQAYQPPFYYAVMAVFVKASQWFGLYSPISYARYGSALFYLLFLASGMAGMRRYIPSQVIYFIGCLMLLVWPLGVTLAGKINNDVPFCAFAALTLYWLLRWREQYSFNAWFAAATVAAFAVAFKSSGYVCVAAVGITGLYMLIKRIVRVSELPWKCLVFLVLIYVFAIGSNTGRMVYYKIFENTHQNLLIGNIYDNKERKSFEILRVENTLYNFLAFEFTTFIDPPYYDDKVDESGRQLFWVSLSKTLLYGDTWWGLGKAAKMLNIVWLSIVMFILASAWWMTHKQLSEKSPLSVAGLLLIFTLAGLMYARYMAPSGCTAHGRYVFHIAIISVLCWGISTSTFEKRGNIAMSFIGVMLGTIFAALSLILVLMQYRFLVQK